VEGGGCGGAGEVRGGRGGGGGREIETAMQWAWGTKKDVGQEGGGE